MKRTRSRPTARNHGSMFEWCSIFDTITRSRPLAGGAGNSASASRLAAPVAPLPVKMATSTDGSHPTSAPTSSRARSIAAVVSRPAACACVCELAHASRK